jgi:hypothetical protein
MHLPNKRTYKSGPISISDIHQTLIRILFDLFFIGIGVYGVFYKCTRNNHAVSFLVQLEVIHPPIFFISDTNTLFSYTLPNVLEFRNIIFDGPLFPSKKMQNHCICLWCRQIFRIGGLTPSVFGLSILAVITPSYSTRWQT